MDTNRHKFGEPAETERPEDSWTGQALEDALDVLLKERDAEPGFTPRAKDWTDLRKRVRIRVNQRREAHLGSA